MTTIATSTADDSQDLRGTKLVVGYVVLGVLLTVAIAISYSVGHKRHAEPSIAGIYASSSACLGKTFKLVQSGQFVDLSDGGKGKLRFQNGHLTGTADCASGGTAALDLTFASAKAGPIL